MLSQYYIIFWLAWTIIMVGGIGFVAWKLISLLQAILKHLEVIMKGEGEIWADGFVTAEIMRKGANSLDKRYNTKDKKSEGFPFEEDVFNLAKGVEHKRGN